MSESEEVSKLKAEITQLRMHLVRHHQLTDAPFLKNYEPYKSLGKPAQDDFNSVFDDLRLKGASIDGDNAYKRDLLDCVVGALATGAQNSNPPLAGHWGQRFWDIGREERASSEQLLKALTALTQVAGECEQIASNYSGTIDGVFEHGGDDHEDPSCAIFHRLYYAMFDARAAIKKANT